MTAAEVTNGLALPYVAVAVAGKGGAVAVLLMTFMAVTSTLSAQIIAVSSILTFDIYRVYFNRESSNEQVIRWGHIGVILFGVVAAAFTAMFHYIGVDMGWTLYMLGKEPRIHSNSIAHLLQVFSRALVSYPSSLPSSGANKARLLSSLLPS